MLLHDTLGTRHWMNHSKQYEFVDSYESSFKIPFNIVEKIRDYFLGGVEEGYKTKFNKSIEKRIKRVIADCTGWDGFILRNLSVSKFIRCFNIYGYAIRRKRGAQK